MVRSSIVGLVVVLLVVKAVASLGNIPTQWTNQSEEQTRTIALPTKDTKAYELVTRSGTVEFAGQDDQTQAAELIARMRVWASTKERAQQALDAIEVTTEGKNTETCQIGWRWRTSPESDWSARVDFELRAPKSIHLTVATRNGQVNVGHLSGDADIKTQNGRIDVETSGRSLKAETNNGEITARFFGNKLHLHTRNGRIAADLSDCHAIEGEITTRNGAVQVRVGKGTSCELVTKTRHGRRNWSGGKLGAGGGKLIASTQNGAVLIDRSNVDAE